MKEGYTLVIGASTNPTRYGYLAVNRLRSHGYPVYAIGLKEGQIGDVNIQTGKPRLEDVHTITLYLNPKRQEEFYDYFLSLKPQRIIFNPGTENPVLEDLARENGIGVEIACTLVMLSTGQY